MASRRGKRPNTFSRGRMSIRQVEVKLEDLEKHVLEAAKEALKKGADIVVEDAKSRCPVYEKHTKELKDKSKKDYFWSGANPGALRDSIKAEAKENDTVYEISANAKNAKGYLYGQIMEFSPAVNRPFLYPAMDAHRKEIQASIIRAIRGETRK